MSQISIKNTGPLRGELIPPPDKSISHRAIILSSLAEGKSIIRNFLYAEDPLSTIGAFKQMGVEIEVGAIQNRPYKQVGASCRSPLHGDSRIAFGERNNNHRQRTDRAEKANGRDRLRELGDHHETSLRGPFRTAVFSYP